MAARSIGRHAAWVEKNLPELANRGQKEIDRVISRSERGLTTLRFFFYVIAVFLALPVSAYLSESLGESSHGWTHRIATVVVLFPLLLLSDFICDQVWRWRIRSAVSA